jgi:ketosteroid isomerase-like protein
MSANLDLVRSIYADWERGNFSRADWADPEIEFVIAEGVNAGSWRGVAATAEAWRDYLRAWESRRVEVEEYRELDEKRVLVLVHLLGRGKTNGLELGQAGAKGANLLHVRNGNVTRLVAYTSVAAEQLAEERG